jgi:hypothetical protein
VVAKDHSQRPLLQSSEVHRHGLGDLPRQFVERCGAELAPFGRSCLDEIELHYLTAPCLDAPGQGRRAAVRDGLVSIGAVLGIPEPFRAPTDEIELRARGGGKR